MGIKMEEKRKDLKNSQQKRIVLEVVERLSSEQPSLYYLPTIEVAAAVKEYIHQPSGLSLADTEMVKHLSRHDIQMLLSLH